MLQVLIGIPPNYHPKAMTLGEIIAFLITVGVIMAGVVITSIIVGITGRKRVQKLYQTKESQPVATQKEPETGNKLQKSAPEEKKESPVRIPSLT